MKSMDKQHRFSMELKMRNESIENPNSPDNLLVPWINSNSRRFYEYGNGNNAAFGRTLLACIFDFADSHNKLLEMFNWLKSNEARNVLLSDACDSSGEWILDAFNQMVELVGKLENETDDDTDDIIRKAIDENAYYLEPLRYDLVLK